MYRCQDDDPPAMSIFSIRLHTGPFITRCRPTNTATIPQRTARIDLRSGHIPRASRPAAYPITGVLEFEARVITLDETTPTAASARYFVLFHHNATNNGTMTAPKVPARMEWPKGPWARYRASRATSDA